MAPSLAHPTATTAYDLRRVRLPAAMPDNLRHHIEAYRAMDAARLSMISVWGDAFSAGRPDGVEREQRDLVFDLVVQLKWRAQAAWDIWCHLSLPVPRTRALVTLPEVTL